MVGADRGEVRSGGLQACSGRKLRAPHREGNSLRRREGRAVSSADLGHGPRHVDTGRREVESTKFKVQSKSKVGVGRPLSTYFCTLHFALSTFPASSLPPPFVLSLRRMPANAMMPEPVVPPQEAAEF